MKNSERYDNEFFYLPDKLENISSNSVTKL